MRRVRDDRIQPPPPLASFPGPPSLWERAWRLWGRGEKAQFPGCERWMGPERCH
jgi:hypothetical protein